MPKTKAVSPARSQGGITTPKRRSTRASRSLCSPALSTASGRLTSLIDQFKDKNMESFALSPLNGRSVLNDNTEIEEPRRKSWWKKLDENSQDVMEVLEDNKLTENNPIEELMDIEVLSQEKKNYTLDLPESSDNESINSIVLPQRRLFTQKEKQPQKKYGHLIDNRESLAKLHKTNTNIDKTVNVGTRELFQNAKRSKPIFPAALLNISPNRTAADKTRENALADPKPQVRNIFGNRPANKRKNMFADFIVSESEDEIPDIQPKVFGFQKKVEQRRVSSVSRGREGSPASSITTDIEMDFRMMLPSSTMVENQLEEMLASTPVKRARLSKLSEAKESEAGTLQTTTSDKTKQSNKSASSKNKSKTSPEIKDKLLNSSRTTRSMLKNASKQEEMINTSVHAKKDKTDSNDVEENEQEDDENNFTLQYENDEEIHSENQKDNTIKHNTAVFEKNSQETEINKSKSNRTSLTNTSIQKLQKPAKTVEESVESQADQFSADDNVDGNHKLETENVQNQKSNGEEMVYQKTVEVANNSRKNMHEEVEHEHIEEVNVSQENEDEANEGEVNQDEHYTIHENEDEHNESHEVANESQEVENQSEEEEEEGNKSEKEEDEGSESEQEGEANESQEVADESQEVANESQEVENEEEQDEGNQSQEVEAEVNDSQKVANESHGVKNDENESKEDEDQANESQEIEAEVNDSHEVANESQVVENGIKEDEDQANESQEVEAEVNDSQEVANESQVVENEIEEDEDKANESREVEAEVNDSQEVANESQVVENEIEEDEDKANESREVEAEVSDSQEVANESQEVEAEVNASHEVANESQVVENEIKEDEDQANESQEVEAETNDSQGVENNENKFEEDEDPSHESREVEAEVNESHEIDEEANESQEIEEEANESQEIDGDAHESHIVEDDEAVNQDSDEKMEEDEEEAANESEVHEASANESQEVENDEEESHVESEAEVSDSAEVEDDQQMDDSDEADKAIATDAEISDKDDTETDEMEVDDDEQESDNAEESEHHEHESHEEREIEEQNEIEPSEEIDESPNVTHDTTGRHRKKNLNKSPEVILHNKTNQIDSFYAKERNTSVRKTKSMIKNLNIKPSLAPPRDSTGFSDGTRNSSAEGSGWDSHRTTRKTLRQTFGKDFTPRKSLRAMVMEKSAKRQTEHMEMHSETVKLPLANSTEMPEDSSLHVEDVESDHELSRRARQNTLEQYLQKIKEQNIDKKLKMEAAVRNSLKAPVTDSLSLFKLPNKPAPRRPKPTQNKPKKQLKSTTPFGELPSEVIEDMKYKPPKRFQPTNASWITKRLYKFLETKLEPTYDYKARVRAEKLVETIYLFAKDLRRHDVAPAAAVDQLKHEFARLNIVRTHFDFYDFFHEFMPREVRIKVVPDIVNKIALPRHGVFSDILRGNTVHG